MTMFLRPSVRLVTRSAIRSRQSRGMAEMPVPQSRNAVLFEGHPKNEGWESTIAWFYPVSFIGICAAYGLAPETEIKSWAQREARVRLEMKAKGVEIEFGRHYADEMQDEAANFWDKFSTKSMRMTEDDDDDDDDDEEEDEEEGEE